jgi:hypothetical protein
VNADANIELVQNKEQRYDIVKGADPYRRSFLISKRAMNCETIIASAGQNGIRNWNMRADEREREREMRRLKTVSLQQKTYSTRRKW